MTRAQPTAKAEKRINLHSLMANRNFVSDEKNMIRQGSVITLGKNSGMASEETIQKHHIIEEDDENITLIEHEIIVKRQGEIERAEGEKIGYERGYADAMQLISLEDQKQLTANLQAIEMMMQKFMEIDTQIHNMNQSLLGITQENIMAMIQLFMPQFLANRTEEMIMSEIRSHFRYTQINQQLIIYCHPEFAPQLQQILEKNAIAREKYELQINHQYPSKRVELEFQDGGVSLQFEKYDQLMQVINQYLRNIKDAHDHHHQFYDNLVGSLVSSFGDDMMHDGGQRPTQPITAPNGPDTAQANHNPANDSTQGEPQTDMMQHNSDNEADNGNFLINQHQDDQHTIAPDSQLDNQSLPDDLPDDLIRQDDNDQPINAEKLPESQTVKQPPPEEIYEGENV